jgi:hypothetical protein
MVLIVVEQAAVGLTGGAVAGDNYCAVTVPQFLDSSRAELHTNHNWCR